MKIEMFVPKTSNESVTQYGSNVAFSKCHIIDSKLKKFKKLKFYIF
jgi:hypothetical protein